VAAVAAPSFRLELLDGKRHDRTAFTCGVQALDRSLRTQAAQDMRRKATAVFVMVPTESPSRIVGYFTLCALALGHGDVPEAARPHLPRYPLVSATLIGRRAIARDRQGQGVGGMLLALALSKAYRNADVVGSSMVVVDATDEPAARFYRAHGFIRLPESMRLILPMRAVARLVGPHGGECPKPSAAFESLT
jgi:GNAT superfamily N-acetyltransferase